MSFFNTIFGNSFDKLQLWLIPVWIWVVIIVVIIALLFFSKYFFSFLSLFASKPLYLILLLVVVFVLIRFGFPQMVITQDRGRYSGRDDCYSNSYEWGDTKAISTICFHESPNDFIVYCRYGDKLFINSLNHNSCDKFGNCDGISVDPTGYKFSKNEHLQGICWSRSDSTWVYDDGEFMYDVYDYSWSAVSASHPYPGFVYLYDEPVASSGLDIFSYIQYYIDLIIMRVKALFGV